VLREEESRRWDGGRRGPDPADHARGGGELAVVRVGQADPGQRRGPLLDAGEGPGDGGERNALGPLRAVRAFARDGRPGGGRRGRVVNVSDLTSADLDVVAARRPNRPRGEQQHPRDREGDCQPEPVSPAEGRRLPRHETIQTVVTGHEATSSNQT